MPSPCWHQPPQSDHHCLACCNVMTTFGLLQAASCAGPYTTPCPANAEGSYLANPWVLEGALVSGPTLASDKAFVDQRIQPDVRVSIEYNAGFTGALLFGPRQANP